MILVITKDAHGNGVVRLDEPNTFTELSVDAIYVSDAEIESIVRATGAGVVEDQHVWIELDFLRTLGNTTEEWNAEFASMISYAARKGWIDSDGSKVRAHLR